MKPFRFQAALVAIFLLASLAACGDRPEAAFSEGPRGYVEFYLPEPRLGEESLGIDTQVYRIENGKREFLGMTQKWKRLAPRRADARADRHGATRQAGLRGRVRQRGGASQPIVHEGTYHRVRIDLTGLSSQQVIGATRQLSFGLKAVAEPPR